MKRYTPGQLRAAILITFALTSIAFLALLDRSCESSAVHPQNPPVHSVSP